MIATTRAPSVILADALYTKRGFIVASGLSETRIREAKQRGIIVTAIVVGKRKFYRGRDIIDYIERLAATEKSQLEAADRILAWGISADGEFKEHEQVYRHN